MSVVSIVRGNDPEKMVRESLELLGGIKSLVSGSSALIKPNLGVWETRGIPAWLSRASTTKPEIVVALIKILQEAGITDTVVGEGAILSLDTLKQFKQSGYKKKVEAAGSRIIDLDREEFIKVKVADKHVLEISRRVMQCENLINVPVMKTHGLTKVTLGMKNLKGVISKQSKRVVHRKDLERSIALLCQAVRPKLTVVDGIMGLEGLGPASWGRPVKLGLIIAGTDPVAVDAVAARIMGQEPGEVEHIRIARELGLGEIDPDRIEIRGLSVDAVKRPFQPAPRGFATVPEFMRVKGVRYFGWKPGDESSECSGCMETLCGGLWALNSDVSDFQKPLDIVIGNRDIPSEAGNNLLLYGNCQAKNREKGTWVKGCPPNIVDAYAAIGNKVLAKPQFAWAIVQRLFKGYKIRALPEWEEYRKITGE
jgi:uncharacterized protein (DUF362 family)